MQEFLRNDGFTALALVLGRATLDPLSCVISYRTPLSAGQHLISSTIIYFSSDEARFENRFDKLLRTNETRSGTATAMGFGHEYNQGCSSLPYLWSGNESHEDRA